jgi:hypothetical protein
MKVVHLIPAGSAFTLFVRDQASKADQSIMEYTFLPYMGIIKPELFWSLFKRYKGNKETLFVFHQVPFLTLLCISYLLRDLKYALYFWGGDYYLNFLPESYLEAKAYSKSDTSKKVVLDRNVYFSCWFKLRRFLSHIVLKRSAGIVSLSHKQFRILKSQHIKLFNSSLTTPFYKLVGYNSYTKPEFRERKHCKEITFLICHSATQSVHHLNSISLIRRYSDFWNVKVNIRGFLSYGGASTDAIDLLEATLMQESRFAHSVVFERNFLKNDDLIDKLKDIDVAVFSCIRDEGVSLLSQLVGMGGLLAFDKLSANFDFFKKYCANKTLDLNDFISISPQTLMGLRNIRPNEPPTLMQYEELNSMKYNNRKLVIK